ncbi:hypothetical protein GIB67_043156 [Kingdonia uniflora]|uniref:F-box domain-containing protein n=1 Tax=Kingdonia uniflora TaxID=39325 RepID=A0A7J7NJD1_9MAGN|nr:hypothetical protein GIB67_043156 [Kingdonia uniflora]
METRSMMKRRLLPKSATGILPEITTEILARLPIRYVFQCRCVCQSWCTIIDDYSFAKVHFSVAMKPTNACTSFLICSYEERQKFYFAEETNGDLVIKGELRLGIPHNYLSLKDMCNGLCLLYSDDLDIYYICNPVTTKYVEIPAIKHEPENIGMGFSVSGQEFKVVHIFGCEAHIFTLGTDVGWRILKTIPYELEHYSCYFNGSLHWLKRKSSSVTNSKTSMIRIMSLNLDSEEFGEVPSPEIGINFGHENRQREYYQLGVLGGYLVLTYFTNQACIDLWFMNDYNVKASWTKQYTVVTKYPSYCYWLDDVTPICFREDGEIIIKRGGGYLTYNPESGAFTRLEIVGLRNYQSIVVFPFLGNLILPTMKYAMFEKSSCNCST